MNLLSIFLSKKMVRIAMCQERCVVGDPKANLQTMSEAITRHGGGGGGGACDAVVFAEMFLQGYGIGYDVAALAEAQNGPSFVAISKMASTANLHVIYSYAEKAPNGRATVFSPAGGISLLLWKFSSGMNFFSRRNKLFW